jgi:hypothetical protein
MYTVVNGQGGIRGESMDGTDRTSESTVNNALSVSEADVLEERELQNGYALLMSVFKRAGDNPSVRKTRCPVTPCVPARLDRRYCGREHYLTRTGFQSLAEAC